MSERDMVMDILSGTKAGLSTYAKTIMECSDRDLRQTFQQMRDSDEQFQYDLYQIAEQKGYYVPSPSTDQLQIDNVRSQLSQSTGVLA